MRSVACAVLLLALATLNWACKKESPFHDVSDTKFHAGQRWSYWARPGEESSTFTIEKIESHPQLGIIVHVGLDNLKLTLNKKTVGLLPHLAFTRDAIDKSAAKKIEDEANIPPYRTDYDAWLKAAEEGKATVIEATIADHLNSIEDK
jgi:hypothetical protein